MNDWNSRDLIGTDKRFVWHPFTNMPEWCAPEHEPPVIVEGRGAILRDAQGRVCEIVEMKRATEEQKRIQEVNSGVYCFESNWLWPALRDLPRNASGEYYLTDIINVGIAGGERVQSIMVPPDEVIGVNSKDDLAMAEKILGGNLVARFLDACE